MKRVSAVTIAGTCLALVIHSGCSGAGLTRERAAALLNDSIPAFGWDCETYMPSNLWGAGITGDNRQFLRGPAEVTGIEVPEAGMVSLNVVLVSAA